MDIDSFVNQHQREWARLEELTGWTGRKARRLSGLEADELVARYRDVSSQLSYARTRYGDATLTARLSALVARSGAAIHANRPATIHSVGRFFTHTFPATICRQWRFVLAAALILFVPAVVSGWYLSYHREVLDYLMPPYAQQRMIEAQLAYYQPGPWFFTKVVTNNIKVSATVFALGAVPVAPCIGPAYALGSNGYRIGEMAAIFHHAGIGEIFLLQIIPHGMLELTAVVLAGAGGLCLGWTILVPGDRTRGQAVAEEGRRSAVLLGGAALMLVISGVIEGFLTGSNSFGPWTKAVVGVGVWLLFIAYVVLLGRRALAEGVTGQLTDDEGGWLEIEPPTRCA